MYIKLPLRWLHRTEPQKQQNDPLPSKGKELLKEITDNVGGALAPSMPVSVGGVTSIVACVAGDIDRSIAIHGIARYVCLGGPNPSKLGFRTERRRV
jgi:hypothetical protein